MEQKKQNFKGISAFIVVSTFLFLGIKGCMTDRSIKEQATIEAAAKASNVNLIVDIRTITGKSIAEVESVLGKAQNTKKIKGYPCENSDCEQASFKNGSYEIIFKGSKADRITIINAPDLTNNVNAIQALGLPASTPALKNQGKVMRWKNIERNDEISFFANYILVQVNAPE